MPDNLTGDFDVVAQFAVPAIDRLMAAMHRCERFPHSMSIRVDDKPRPEPGLHPSIIEAVDQFGGAIADAGRVGSPLPTPGPLAATSALHAGLGLLVNSDRLEGTLELPPLVPSHLAGVAQLQLGPPTVEVPDASGTKLTARLPVRARYRPDLNTARASEFVHGELRLTAAINQVVSQGGVNTVEIDIKDADVQAALVPSWTSTPLSAADLAGIQLLLRNALRTSFLPSNARLPDRMKHLQVKTLQGSGGVVAVLLDMGPTRGAASTVTTPLVRAGDDFALGVGRDFMLTALEPVLENLRTRPIEPVPVHLNLGLGTLDGKYAITISSATADLHVGKIVLTLKGRASGDKWWTPNFNFTTRLAFGLAADGDSVALIPGDISVETSSTLIEAFAKGAVERGIRKSRDAVLSRAGALVSDLLSANKNLGEFLRSLLNSARQLPGLPPLQDVFLLLWYTAVDIQPTGLTLRGELGVNGWPQAHVEYEPVPPSTGPGPAAGGVVAGGKDFSALKAWIPGGVIDRFEWSTPGQQQPSVDEHRFVLRRPEPGLATAAAATSALRPLADAMPSVSALHAYAPLCLTIRGTRLTAWGPIARKPVSGSVCGYGTFPLLDAVAGALETGAMVALAKAGANGLVHVVGHMPAQVDRSGRGAPNRVIHFADDQSAARLDVLGQAVRESGRADAATAVVAVLTSKQLAGALHESGVVYADGDDGAWRRAFGLGEARGATTLIVSPRGEIAWRHEGTVDGAALTAALRKVLVPGPGTPRALHALNLRLGRVVPNFVFEPTPGHALTLRKLAGRAAVLVFWRSTSKISIEAIRAHETRAARPSTDRAPNTKAPPAPVVLAINDGEPPELARRVAVAHGLKATIVPDPQRSISAAYGVSLWPTTVLIDAQGVATSIAYGREDGDHDEPPAGGDRKQEGAR